MFSYRRLEFSKLKYLANFVKQVLETVVVKLPAVYASHSLT